MKTYFASDAHLGSWAFDDTIAHERKLVRWLDSIKPDCEALYLLGDMIDFWFEYKHVVPKGFNRFFGKLAEFTDQGISVHWFIGNHDIWLFRYVQEELGVIVHKEPQLVNLHGKSFYMAHGDGLGDPSTGFRFLRSVFHNRFNQRLFALLHPNLGIGFGFRWAKHSRLKREKDPEKYLGEENEYLIQFAKQHAAALGSEAPDFYVFGHRHILLDLMISGKSRVVILGDWFRQFSYGELDENGFSLELFEVQG
jgi:UDP-2,3-diacylglucosamine hydrolase